MKKIIILIFPFLIFFVTIPIRYNSFLLDFIFTSIIFLIISLLFFRFKILSSRNILIYSFIGYLLLFGIMVIVDGIPSIIFIPNYFAYGLSVLVAYIFSIAKTNKNKIGVVSIYLLTLVLYSNFLYSYIENLQNAGTLTGIINKKTNFNIIAIDENGKNFEFNNSKIYVLDFWFAGCSACLKEFPNFNNLYLKNINNTKLEFASINIPLNNNKELLNSFLNEINEKQYKFPVYTNKNNIDNILNITNYPIIIICNKDSIFFKGSLNLSKEYLIEHKLISTEYD
jgi:thiol-disulfide isomerase/thioredoxin